jgi:hypothetical protein
MKFHEVVNTVEDAVKSTRRRRNPETAHAGPSVKESPGATVGIPVKDVSGVDTKGSPPTRTENKPAKAFRNTVIVVTPDDQFTGTCAVYAPEVTSSTSIPATRAIATET